MRPWMGLALFAALAGCGTGGSEFPLAVGKSWTYRVRSGLNTRVEDVRVMRELPVAGARGFELGGPLGQSRLVWKNGVLLADRLANASFDPPLPLLVGGKASAEQTWSGDMSVLGTIFPARATLEQRPETRQIGGRQLETTRATVRIRMKERSIEMITWYSPGFGPIAQEQRTDERMDIDLEAVAVP